MLYCNSLTEYSRFRTREVRIGDLLMGADHPIRIQSMTTTDTMDTNATVDQSIRMIEAGCEIVRITAPSLNDARNLQVIRDTLRKKGYNTPLAADIHFTPNAAEFAARVVEKVRVNPGNYADKKKFEHIDYTDASYADELERIRNRFIPLIAICKEYGTAMRIGTNHGSLSDRILSRYGDTPLGMVESAMEFINICEQEGYRNLVISMKASNPQVMVQAYRLLVSRMMQSGQDYPLHLGVTEAGDGEDGRIKSAAGIGTLLEDGLGDTVRVSLTEEPEYEIPVARALVDRYSNRKREHGIPDLNFKLSAEQFSPFDYKIRHTHEVFNMGGGQVPRVVADLHDREISPASLFAAGYQYSVSLDKWNISDNACDFIYAGDKTVSFALPGTLGIIHTFDTWLHQKEAERRYPIFSLAEYLLTTNRHAVLNFIAVDSSALYNLPREIQEDNTCVLVVSAHSNHAMAEIRRGFFELLHHNNTTPIIVKSSYNNLDTDTFRLWSATDVGALLIDGFGNGVWLESKDLSPLERNQTSFNILQATRTRISKTEYISCPSCGRTLFDLQETTARIRERTSHLKGVKIGIMGCIVNGPGEMADADYGYVGTGPGKITLYKGREVVKKNIPSTEAVDALIDLIRAHGDWIDKPVTEMESAGS